MVLVCQKSWTKALLTCGPTTAGLIIDAFGELRDQQEQVKEDMEVKTKLHTLTHTQTHLVTHTVLFNKAYDTYYEIQSIKNNSTKFRGCDWYLFNSSQISKQLMYYWIEFKILFSLLTVSLADKMFHLWDWQRLLWHSAAWLWNAHVTGAQPRQLPVSTPTALSAFLRVNLWTGETSASAQSRCVSQWSERTCVKHPN